MSIRYRLRSVIIEGETAAYLALSRIRWKPLCEKKLAGPTQHTAAAPNFLISHTRVDT